MTHHGQQHCPQDRRHCQSLTYTIFCTNSVVVKAYAHSLSLQQTAKLSVHVAGVINTVHAHVMHMQLARLSVAGSVVFA